MYKAEEQKYQLINNSVEKVVNANQKIKLKSILKDQNHLTLEFNVLKKVVEKFVSHSKKENKKIESNKEKQEFIKEKE